MVSPEPDPHNSKVDSIEINLTATADAAGMIVVSSYNGEKSILGTRIERTGRASFKLGKPGLADQVEQDLYYSLETIASELTTLMQLIRDKDCRLFLTR